VRLFEDVSYKDILFLLLEAGSKFPVLRKYFSKLEVPKYQIFQNAEEINWKRRQNTYSEYLTPFRSNVISLAVVRIICFLVPGCVWSDRLSDSFTSGLNDFRLLYILILGDNHIQTSQFEPVST
jgi:hypothetical protein